MSRSSAALILLFVALVALPASLAESEDSKLLDDRDAGNVTASNMTAAKEDTFADIIDRALEKEFTENEDQNKGFLDLNFHLIFALLH